VSKLLFNLVLCQYGTLREAGREEDQTIVGEDQLSEKQGEGGMN
jgi:hypothetical protein